MWAKFLVSPDRTTFQNLRILRKMNVIQRLQLIEMARYHSIWMTRIGILIRDSKIPISVTLRAPKTSKSLRSRASFHSVPFNRYQTIVTKRCSTRFSVSLKLFFNGSQKSYNKSLEVAWEQIQICKHSLHQNLNLSSYSPRYKLCRISAVPPWTKSTKNNNNRRKLPFQ